MYRTIVLALDGSEGADRALPIAGEYARRDGARIIVAHARTHAIEPAIEAKLHAQVDELRRAGTETSLIIEDSLMGREADVIADSARAHAGDVIVIASRGRGPWKGAVLGSVTLRLLSLAPCPVLVVPGGYEAPDRIVGAAVATGEV